MAKVTPKQETLSNFEKLYGILFSGDVPDRDDLFERVKAGDELTVREAFLARMYAQGIEIAPAVLKDERLGPIAKDIQDRFGKPNTDQPVVAGGLAKQIETVSNKAGGLDASYQQLVSDAEAGKITGVSTQIKALQRQVENFKKGALGKVGGTADLKFAKAPTDRTIKAIVEGIARIPDENLRDAVYLSIFGMRSKALSQMATDFESASELEVPRPYFDAETGTVETPKVKGRKQLGEPRKMGPIATSILQRRAQAAVDAGETFIFPDISDAQIQKALKDYVFNKKFFPAAEVNHLGRLPTGMTDLRRLFVSYVGNNYPDDLATAETLLGHSAPPKGATKVGARFYLTVDSTEAEAIGTFLTEFEQRVAQTVGAKSYNDFSAKLGVPFDDTSVVNFVNIETQKDEIKAGLREKLEAEKTPMSDAERQALEAERIATLNKGAGEANRAAELAGVEAETAKRERLRLARENAELQATAPTKKDILQKNAIQDAEEIASKTGGLNLGGIFDFGKKALGALGVPGMGYIDTENRLGVLEQAGYVGPQAEQYVTQDIGMKEGPLGVVELVGQGMRAGMEQLGIKEPLSQEEIDAQQVQAYENQLLNMGINPEDIKAR